MRRDVMWEHRQKPGLEHLRLDLSPGGAVAEGMIIGIEDDRPFRVRYEIRCDEQWRVRRASIALLGPGPGQGALVLHADGHGHWTGGSGETLLNLAGCIDIDITATPFTNTLPIRRLSWRAGASEGLLVAYVTVPELQLTSEQQRYTLLEAQEDGALYRFEALSDGFTAVISVDPEGLVVDYPGLFRRVWSGRGV